MQKYKPGTHRPTPEYSRLHVRIRKIKPPPWACERCGKVKPLDAANLDGRYTEDPKTWAYLCRRCHKIHDNGGLKKREPKDFRELERRYGGKKGRAGERGRP